MLIKLISMLITYTHMFALYSISGIKFKYVCILFRQLNRSYNKQIILQCVIEYINRDGMKMIN